MQRTAAAGPLDSQRGSRKHPLTPGGQILVLFPGTELHDPPEAQSHVQRDICDGEALARHIGRCAEALVEEGNPLSGAPGADIRPLLRLR